MNIYVYLYSMRVAVYLNVYYTFELKISDRAHENTI